MKRTIFSLFCLMLFSIGAMAQTTNSNSNAGDKKADPAAWKLLKSTRQASQNFPANFAGVTADIVLNDNGKIAKGALSYAVGKSGELNIEGLDENTKDWLNDQTMSVISHRRGGDFAKGDGRHPITFGEDDNSPIGRRVVLNDSLRSSYRIRNQQVVEVDRTMGGDHFTITVLETTPVAGGKSLPRHFTVTYFDAKSGAIKRSEAFTDEYKLVDGVWFPASRRVVRAENGKVITRVIEFHNPRIQFNKEQASR
ncbi:MAG: DUF3386 family protein [Blastocatellales bacterium]